jgi:hypothetical protein
MNDTNYIPLRVVVWWFAIGIIAGMFVYLMVR